MKARVSVIRIALVLGAIACFVFCFADIPGQFEAHHRQEYNRLKKEADILWQNYRQAHPDDAALASGKLVQIGSIASKKKNMAVYAARVSDADGHFLLVIGNSEIDQLSSVFPVTSARVETILYDATNGTFSSGMVGLFKAGNK